MSHDPPPRPGTGPGSALGRMAFGAFSLVMSLLGLVLEPLQRLTGVRRMAWVFLLPNLLIFGIFILFPMAMNFYYAMTSGTSLYPQDRPFVGAENFTTLYDCGNYLDPNTCREDRFWRAVWNTGTFVILQVGGMVLLSLLTALVLNGRIVARGFFRSVFFYPVLLSPVVVALIWKWILQRDGLLNALLVGVGLDPIQFMLHADWAMFWVIVVTIWANMGFYTLILLAGLQSIPTELYDAGAIDGTSRWQRLWYITLPLLMPNVMVVLVLALIRAVQMFDEVFVLTGGGPGSATLFLVQYIYEVGFASQIQRFGLAAGASVTLGVALLIITLIQLRLGRGSERHLA
ncbi:MAG: sugar ABC transporter permease [Trueperaceae bacterium]|nr:sugar ABC transporter permease [Trueperaceae bacterium]